MSRKMTKVSKEEFEQLTKFFPGEIRYYVDMPSHIRRRKGARVTVKRKPASPDDVKATAGKRRRQSTSAINGTGRGTNLPIIFKGGESAYGDKSIKGRKVEVAVHSIFNGDPTKVLGKVELINKVVAMTTLHRSSVAPAVSFLIKKGVLAHKEAAQ